jgi:hypothetical protein
MTRLEHFIRGNGLSATNVAEWATMKEPKLRAVVAGEAVPKLYEAYRLTAACSYLLGRRVRITELFDLGEHER